MVAHNAFPAYRQDPVVDGRFPFVAGKRLPRANSNSTFKLESISNSTFTLETVSRYMHLNKRTNSEGGIVTSSACHFLNLSPLSIDNCFSEPTRC